MGCAAVLLFAWAGPARAAAVIHPTRTDDGTGSGCPTDCTLREAIAAALPGDTVSLAPPAPAGPYALGGTGALDIEKNITIAGAGVRSTTITGSAGNANIFTVGQTQAASVTIAGLTVTGGTGRFGGGVQVGTNGTLTLDSVAVTGNNGSVDTANQQGSFGGGIYSFGSLTVVNSTIANNTVRSVAGNSGLGSAGGGGIWIQSGTARITNSTIAGNQAVHPANTSTASGGGIGTQGELTLANVTLAGNSAGSFGGDLRAQTASQVTVKNTIVSGGATTAGTGNENCYIGPTTPFAEDHNVEDRNQCHFAGAGDHPGADPLLGTLANNGGPTDTMALPPASPAVDHGNPGGCTDALGAPLTVDQRGIARPQGAACDIGAFELVPTPAGGGGGGGNNGGGGGAGTDVTAPVIGSASASPNVFAVDPSGRAETPVAAKARHGTNLRYSLSEAGRVVFTIQRAGPGRKVGRRCVKPTRRNRRARRCTRFTTVGRFAVASRAGANSHRFSGKIGRRTLTPGSYRALLVGTDAAGNHSRQGRITFRVVRG